MSKPKSNNRAADARVAVDWARSLTDARLAEELTLWGHGSDRLSRSFKEAALLEAGHRLEQRSRA